MFFERLVLATGNRGKHREFARLLPKNFVGELVLASDLSANLNASINVNETGDTYAVNALLKARAWAEAAGLPALADDSGLEVDALDGAPGVRSARIVPGSDLARIEWLLGQLAAREREGYREDNFNRSARFVAALALVVPVAGKKLQRAFIFEGECRGRIARALSGDGGFGYDPLFIPDGFDKSFAELPPDVKNKISHRADAVENMLATLSEFEFERA